MRRSDSPDRRQTRQDAGTLGWPRGRADCRRSRRLARALPRRTRGGARMNPRDASDSTIVNALTIDVEDYFQVSAFAAHIPRASWDSLPCRVERNIDRILALLAEV